MVGNVVSGMGLNGMKTTAQGTSITQDIPHMSTCSYQVDGATIPFHISQRVTEGELTDQMWRDYYYVTEHWRTPHLPYANDGQRTKTTTKMEKRVRGWSTQLEQE